MPILDEPQELRQEVERLWLMLDPEFEQAERWKPVLLRNRFAGRSTADMTLRLGEVLAYPALGTKPQFGRPVQGRVQRQRRGGEELRHHSALP